MQILRTDTFEDIMSRILLSPGSECSSSSLYREYTNPDKIQYLDHTFVTDFECWTYGCMLITGTGV
jgi:hypothetical protein